jgi:multiple sugar transport system substrate-binding protein
MSNQALSRRDFLRWSATIAAGAALTACAKKATEVPAQPTEAPEAAPTAAPTEAPTEAPPEAPTQAPAEEVITVDMWVQEVSIPPQKAVSAKFTEKNPNISINFVPTTLADTTTKLLAAIAAGSGGPDIAFVQYTDMINFTLRGGEGITDLSPMLEGRKDEWLAWCLDLVTTSEGKILGLPTDVGVAATFYTRDVFERAGLPSDPDSVAASIATWDDFLATSEKIAAVGDQWMIADAGELFEIFRQQGEQAYFDESGQPIVNSEVFVNAAKYAQEYRQAGLDADADTWGTEWGDMLVRKVLGAFMSAAWWDIILHAYAPDSGGSWGVAPLPGGSSANFGGSYFVIPEMSPKREAAWAYASFAVASLEGIELYLTGGAGLWLPGWKKAYELPVFTNPDPFYADQPWLQIFVQNAENVPMIRLTVNDSIAAAAVSDALARVLDEGADPQAALDEANEQIKAQLGL